MESWGWAGGGGCEANWRIVLLWKNAGYAPDIATALQ